MGFQDRDYVKNDYEPPNLFKIPTLSSVVWLILVCLILFLISTDVNLRSMHDVSYDAIFYKYHIWAILFSPLTPTSFMGLLSVALVLYFFGNRLVDIYGFKEFLSFYFLCAIVGLGGYWGFSALTTNDVSRLEPWEWSLLGVMLLFTLRSYNERALLYFVLPIKLKYLMGFILLLEFTTLMRSHAVLSEYISLFAVLLFTFLYFKFQIRLLRLADTVKKIKGQIFTNREYQKFEHKPEKEMKQEIDRILDKITANGVSSLSNKEKDLLKQASKSIKSTNGKQ